METDYVKKRSLYQRTGVQEYWIADRERRTVEVWRLEGARASSELYQAGEIKSTLIPALAVEVSSLWQ